MGAALTIFVLLSLSIFVVRVASVALRITDLSEASARFQALSAFTGTGFTTETVVNYPIRRRVVSILMIIGNMGLVTVFATVVVSLVHTDGEVDAVVAQLAWLLGGLALLWFLMLNGTADRILCTFIGDILESTTFLGRRNFHRVLQVGEGYSVCEHPAAPPLLNESGNLAASALAALELSVLAVRSPDGKLSAGFSPTETISTGDTLVLFGRDAGHERAGCRLCGIADSQFDTDG